MSEVIRKTIVINQVSNQIHSQVEEQDLKLDNIIKVHQETSELGIKSNDKLLQVKSKLAKRSKAFNCLVAMSVVVILAFLLYIINKLT